MGRNAGKNLVPPSEGLAAALSNELVRSRVPNYASPGGKRNQLSFNFPF